MDIRVEGVSKRYVSAGKGVQALHEVNLSIPTRQVYTLLGPSGCGKTTLLRCLVGLESPDAGEIAIGGDVVWSKARGIAVPPDRRGLGMVFQTYAIWPHLNVFDNVAYPLQVRGGASDDIRRRVAKVLSLVHLEGLEDRPATKLSGGQQQRVALARALVGEPKVILFDEPLSNLDAKLRDETRKELRTFLTALNITAVYVTHDRTEALALSDRIAVMREGRIVEEGTPREIYFNTDHQFVADFIGRANLVRAKVRSQQGERTIVDSGLGLIACSRRDFAPGREVTLCIRPESIRLVRDGAGGENRFVGRIEVLTFIGEAVEAELRVGEERLLARLDGDVSLETGGAVSFCFDPGHCLLIAD